MKNLMKNSRNLKKKIKVCGEENTNKYVNKMLSISKINWMKKHMKIIMISKQIFSNSRKVMIVKLPMVPLKKHIGKKLVENYTN